MCILYMDYVDEKTKITFHLNNYQLLQCVITRNLFIFSEYFIDIQNCFYQNFLYFQQILHRLEQVINKGTFN